MDDLVVRYVLRLLLYTEWRMKKYFRVQIHEPFSTHTKDIHSNRRVHPVHYNLSSVFSVEGWGQTTSSLWRLWGTKYSNYKTSCLDIGLYWRHVNNIYHSNCCFHDYFGTEREYYTLIKLQGSWHLGIPGLLQRVSTLIQIVVRWIWRWRDAAPPNNGLFLFFVTWIFFLLLKRVLLEKEKRQDFGLRAAECRTTEGWGEVDSVTSMLGVSLMSNPFIWRCLLRYLVAAAYTLNTLTLIQKIPFKVMYICIFQYLCICSVICAAWRCLKTLMSVCNHVLCSSE